jgi:hypothetical protein
LETLLALSPCQYSNGKGRPLSHAHYQSKLHPVRLVLQAPVAPGEVRKAVRLFQAADGLGFGGTHLRHAFLKLSCQVRNNTQLPFDQH